MHAESSGPWSTAACGVPRWKHRPTPQSYRFLDEWLAGATVGDLIEHAFAAVGQKRVLPSMRSLQFGGEAILLNNTRMFNCAFSAADRPEFFREYFFLLLAGTGCGFSVQRHHIALMPALGHGPRGGSMKYTPKSLVGQPLASKGTQLFFNPRDF